MSVGDILGESGALSGMPRGAQLVCRNKCMLYEMSREDFLRMLTTEQLGKIRQVVRMRDSVTARLIESVRAARTHVRRARLSFLATGMCVGGSRDLCPCFSVVFFRAFCVVGWNEAVSSRVLFYATCIRIQIVLLAVDALIVLSFVPLPLLHVSVALMDT